MKRLTDDEWLAHARAGTFEAAPVEEVAALPEAPSPQDAPAGPRCPYCASHPPLEAFPRRYAISRDALMYCHTCLGFWAPGDSLSHGVADPEDDSRALTVATAPRRCRSCFGHLKPDDTCTKCGQTPAMLNCPACARQMERAERSGLRLDICRPCDATWFDTGEIGALFGFQPVQGWAASQVDETAAPTETSLILQALSILGRVFIPIP